MLGGDGGLLKRTKGNMAHRELLYMSASLYHSSTGVIKQSGGSGRAFQRIFRTMRTNEMRATLHIVSSLVSCDVNDFRQLKQHKVIVLGFHHRLPLSHHIIRRR